LAYEIIDYKAEVQTNPNGKVLPKEEIKGEIVFKNVSFRYPTR
jgi:ABC-type bacteriocin/lantibiotic exporter with double-glycine peptidase domain